jgi:glycosyltransferase involved in cell wall biosynthesis
MSLSFLYRTVDQIFLHTEEMKRELVQQFGVAERKVQVVPFGINDVIPIARINRSKARQELRLGPDQKVLLFFGNIAPYKGIEDLVRALSSLLHDDTRFILILAGPVKDRRCEAYWADLKNLIAALGLSTHVREEIRYVPDREVGLFFRAADVSVLPYRRVYQSGVVALSYAQGLPVIASDVGPFKADVIDGETGLVFRSGDPADLANKIRAYFASDLFKNLEARRPNIRVYGAQAFSWTRNGDLTVAVYERLLQD